MSKLIFPIPVLSFIDINLNDINCLEIMFGYTMSMKTLKRRSWNKEYCQNKLLGQQMIPTMLLISDICCKE